MEYKGKIETYITKTLGLPCEAKGSFRVSLPLYLKGRFDFHLVSMDGNDFLLLMPKKGVQMTASVICSSAESIRKQSGLNTVVAFDGIDSETRRTLISKRVSFIVPEKQLYIPNLGIILQERGLLNGRERKSETLSPAAQRLVLYHLQAQSLDGLSLNHVSELIGYPAKTVTQIVKELENKGLCKVSSQTPRSKVLNFTEGGKNLWVKAYQYMQSPIKTICYVDDIDALDGIETAYTYDQALGHYTFIAENDSLARAIYWRSEKIKFIDFNKNEGNIRVELWKYPPVIINNSDFVDPLSLALCYKDINDERVDDELHKLIDKTIER